MSLATYLKSNNYLSNQRLDEYRDYFSNSETSKESIHTFNFILVNRFLNPGSFSEIQPIALFILFQELLNPLSLPVQLNYTLLLSLCASIGDICVSIALLGYSLQSLKDMCFHIYNRDATKAYASLVESVISIFYAISAWVLGAIALALSILTAGLSLITRPLATLYYTGEYFLTEPKSSLEMRC